MAGGIGQVAELSLGRLAASTPNFLALPALAEAPGFNGYSTREQFWSEQINEVKRTTG
jgi:hypothetical protein